MKKILSSVLAASIMLGAINVFASGSSDRAEQIAENYALAREAASEGIVLLENNGALPLSTSDSVSLFGIGSKRLIKGGTGSGLVYTNYYASLIDGMRNADNSGLITLNEGLNSLYEAHYQDWLRQYNNISVIEREGKPISEIELTDTQISDALAVSDTAIYTISRVQGEGTDRSAVAGDYYISDVERANLTKINNAGFDKIIVILNVGTSVDTSFISEFPNIDALLITWLPGTEGGNALADVLCGVVNPSGKLADTFVKSYNDLPSSKTFSESNAYVNYYEDIYNGYRYFETFDPNYEKVNYEFGYGLSYTTFEIKNDKVTNDGKNITVTATVKNTGAVAGKEVVQVYFSAPNGLLGKPAKELAAYVKTNIINPGESQTVSASFAIDDMTSFDDLGKTGNKSAYVLEAGDYKIFVGNSIKNAGMRGVKGVYNVPVTVVTEQLTSLLTPKSLSKRLVNNGSGSEAYESLSVTSEPDGSLKPDFSSGIAIIEAENHQSGSGSFEYPVLPEQNNLKYLTGFNKDEYVTYDIKTDEDMELAISLSVTNLSGSSLSNPIAIYVNDAIISSNLTIPSTGTNVFTNVKIGNGVFKEGKNTLKIEALSNSSLGINHIELKPLEGRTVISGDTFTVIEAESFNTSFNPSGTAVGMKISTENALGETLVSKLSGNGKYVEYYVKTEKAGNYKMRFAYAATADFTSPFSVLINGANQNVSLTMPKTSPEGMTAADGAAFYNTSNWMTSSVEIYLPRGFSTIKLLSKGNCPNLNKFVLTPCDVNEPDYESIGHKEEETEAPEGYITILPNKKATIEMENYVNKSGSLRTTQLSDGASNGEVVLINVYGTNYTEYNLWFKEGGTYKLNLNYAAWRQMNRNFKFYANGELLQYDAYSLESTSNGTGTYDYYYNFRDKEINITMPKGAVTFRIYADDSVSVPMCNLNKFTLERNYNIPDGYSVLEAYGINTIEAENCITDSNAGSYSGNISTRTLNQGLSNGETIVENINGGEWLEYNLFVKDEGDYIFNFNYSSNKNTDNPYTFAINGKPVSNTNYSMPSTSSTDSVHGDSTYQTYFVFENTSVGTKLALPQGEVRLRLIPNVGNTVSVPNLNKITVSKSYTAPDGVKFVSPAGTTVFEAEDYDGLNTAPTYTIGNVNKNITVNSNYVNNPAVGSAFIEYLSSQAGGRYLEYKLYTATAGKYALALNYACYNDTANQSKFTFYSVDKNGTATSLPYSTYSLPSTRLPNGSTTVENYYNFKDSQNITITLPKGEFIFRIRAGAGTVPNFNSFKLSLLEPIETEEPEEAPEDETPVELKADYCEETPSAPISFFEVINGNKTMAEFLAQMSNLELCYLAGGHPGVTGSQTSFGRLRKYDIPTVSVVDGGAGIRVWSDGMTCWPCSTMLACTWNLELIHRVGEGVGKDAEFIGLDAWLAPGMNIHRNPLCGRNFEYYSEDPLISGNCASEITLGARAYGLDTVAKHFAVNNKESGRTLSDSRISARALREIYLKGFEILVKKTDPNYIMSSYNFINGTETAESKELCTTVLRKDWGFNGVVMTDWSNDTLHTKEILAGNNLKTPYGDIQGLLNSLKSGAITRNDLKKNAENILLTLAKSRRYEIMTRENAVNIGETTVIKAIDFAFTNDNYIGVSKAVFQSGSNLYKVGDYAAANSGGASLHASGYYAGIGMNKNIINDNINFGNSTNECFLEFFATAKATGDYKLSASFISTGSVDVYVDGRIIGTVSAGTAVNSVARSEELSVHLSAGRHIIKTVAKQDATRLLDISITGAN